MKITLAFDIFNKERWIKSLLESWLDNISGENDYEVIVVFDACKDNSPAIAKQVLEARKINYKFLFANDEYEIYCNDLAFKNSTGDFIIFIQDDNWIYDKNWDVTLFDVLQRIEKPGAVGFLAGVETRKSWRNLLRRFDNRRIEVNRPHKGENFQLNENFDLAVWAVDAINRPFGISISLLRDVGGLDFAFRPSCFDDFDLSLKLLKLGYTNIYIPFDLRNTASEKSTISLRKQKDIYINGRKICFSRYGKFILQRKHTSFKKLFPLEIKDGILQLV